MDKKEFIITLGDQQGLKFSRERAEKMTEKDVKAKCKN